MSKVWSRLGRRPKPAAPLFGSFPTQETQDVAVLSVNLHESRNHPEPYKRTLLCDTTSANGCAGAPDSIERCWSVELVLPEDEQTEGREHSAYHCGVGQFFEHEFTHPGSYDVSTGGHAAATRPVPFSRL